MHRRLIEVAAAAALTLSLVATAEAQRRPAKLHMGIADPVLRAPDTADRWLGLAFDAGARTQVATITWAAVAPQRPQTPTDPGDPAYRWGALDAAVIPAVRAGVAPVIMVTQAPAWAEGSGRSKSVRLGAWKPSATAYGRFATALATRYSGTYQPAGETTPLPRVSAFQAWAEPNLKLNLAPQWRGRKPASPGIYRRLLNRFTAGIKRAQPDATVATAGTAPFGDGAGGARMRPALFVRRLLAKKVTFDVLTHHPYSVGRPGRKALNRDDVSIPDLHKLTGPLRAAERRGTALPKGTRHRLWITEFSWDSKPPDPDGVPEARRARWASEAFRRFWLAGVDTVYWYLIRDRLPTPSYAATYQSGLYTHDGTAKLTLRAFEFPFTVVRSARGRALVWAVAPQAGSLQFEVNAGRGWRAVSSHAVEDSSVVQRSIRAARGARVRARVGAETSLTQRVR